MLLSARVQGKATALSWNSAPVRRDRLSRLMEMRLASSAAGILLPPPEGTM